MKPTFSAALALALIATPLGAAAQMSPTPQPPTVAPGSPVPSGPVASPTPAPTATPAVAPSAAPTTPPTGPVSPAPTASPNVYRFTTMPTPQPNADANAPRIVEIDANDSTLHAPGPIMLRVLTSPNVVNVVARIMGHEVAIPKVEAGIFAANGQLPGVPFFLYGRHDVVFVAAGPDGRTVSSTVTVSLAH